MQHLIATSAHPFVSSRGLSARSVRSRSDLLITASSAPPEKFRPPEEPPELILDEPGIDQTGIGRQGAPASVNERAPITTPGAFRNGPALALVAVAPVYPARAAARGLEGYVIDQFTITALGTGADVIVTDSSNALFDRYAIDAAYKFKSKPRVIDGEPVECRGVLNKFTFVLED